MPIIIALILFLSACSSDVSKAQAALDSYAQSLTNQKLLAASVTGSALSRTQASITLVDRLQLRSHGQAVFEIWSYSNRKASGCLDLGGVRYTNSSGEFIDPPGNRLVKFSAVFDDQFLIREIEIQEESC